jgi:Tol biopolymer transport system component
MSDAWGPPVNLAAPVNSEYAEGNPAITADGLTLYFSSLRPGGLGGWDIWLTTRPTRESPWGQPVNLGSAINSAGDEFFGCISVDGCSLYFSNALVQAGGYFYGGDIYMTTRPTKDSPWGPPVNLGLMPSRGGSGNWNPSISADGLALFFESDYVNVSLFPDIWLATRTSNDSKWGTPILLGPEINTQTGEGRPSISADGRTLYFSSMRPTGYGGSWDTWQAPVIPVVDFNGDKKVDIQDLLRLIESWGEDDPSVDMGPMPWGDGKVDEKDLEVLMSYWQQEILPPELAAYWKLDEAEGSVAQNSVSDYHGILHGEPLWQPAGGKKAGGLQFDGVDDYVSTAFVLDPSAGPFSVFAWIQGGTPGQAIISQTDAPNGTGETWLGADTLEGKLMTGLRPPGQRGPTPPMVSNAVITNGEWHHVALVVSGHQAQARELYADGTRVAFDSQPGKLPSSGGGLYFGADKALGAASFFADKIEALAQ